MNFKLVANGYLIVAAGLLTVGLAQAQVGSTSAYVNATHEEIESFWTVERMLKAKPMVSVARTPQSAAPMTDTLSLPSGDGSFVSVPGHLPEIPYDPANAKVLIPAAELEKHLGALPAAKNRPAPGPVADAVSSGGALFTTSRVFPDAALASYPYSAIGKLIFHDPRQNSDFVCSGSVLPGRIVLTAGHCVYHPSANPSDRYWYTNFRFIPADNNGIGPHGTFTANQVWVAEAWSLSDGSFPNPQDVAALVMNDVNGRKISSYTGSLGYWAYTGLNHGTGILSNNNLTMLGYPDNLDSGNRMQVTYAQSFQDGGNNTWRYGSAMSHGASGGPWIQNFGVNPAGNTYGAPLGQNQLVGVTSYVSQKANGDSLNVLGASILDARFFTLLSDACAGSGNCTN